MTGILYGIGVGPGDPELMTVKAVRRIKDCDVIAIPNENKKDCTAYKIAVEAVPEIDEKEFLYLSVPMTKDKMILETAHNNTAGKIKEILKTGRNIGMLTLGDSTIYSTCGYIMELVRKDGFETKYESGVPSFCAAAARLGIPLSERFDEIHIIPASYDAEEAVKLPGVKVLMKAGSKSGCIKKILSNGSYDVNMVENCGMPGEKVYRNISEIPEKTGYFSLWIVKDKKI